MKIWVRAKDQSWHHVEVTSNDAALTLDYDWSSAAKHAVAGVDTATMVSFARGTVVAGTPVAAAVLGKLAKEHRWLLDRGQTTQAVIVGLAAQGTQEVVFWKPRRAAPAAVAAPAETAGRKRTAVVIDVDAEGGGASPTPASGKRVQRQAVGELTPMPAAVAHQATAATPRPPTATTATAAAAAAGRARVPMKPAAKRAPAAAAAAPAPTPVAPKPASSAWTPIARGIRERMRWPALAAEENTTLLKAWQSSLQQYATTFKDPPSAKKALYEMEMAEEVVKLTADEIVERNKALDDILAAYREKARAAAPHLEKQAAAVAPPAQGKGKGGKKGGKKGKKGGGKKGGKK